MTERYDYKAVLIGNYAYCRFMFMQHCISDIFKESLNKEEFWEHLADVQKTVEAYMENYRRLVIHSDEFRRSDDQCAFLGECMNAEEERIGNKWICVKNPYDFEDYCMWSAAAHISTAAEK